MTDVCFLPKPICRIKWQQQMMMTMMKLSKQAPMTFCGIWISDNIYIYISLAKVYRNAWVGISLCFMIFSAIRTWFICLLNPTCWTYHGGSTIMHMLTHVDRIVGWSHTYTHTPTLFRHLSETTINFLNLFLAYWIIIQTGFACRPNPLQTATNSIIYLHCCKNSQVSRLYTQKSQVYIVLCIF